MAGAGEGGGVTTPKQNQHSKRPELSTFRDPAEKGGQRAQEVISKRESGDGSDRTERDLTRGYSSPRTLHEAPEPLRRSGSPARAARLTLQTTHHPRPSPQPPHQNMFGLGSPLAAPSLTEPASVRIQEREKETKRTGVASGGAEPGRELGGHVHAGCGAREGEDARARRETL